MTPEQRIAALEESYRRLRTAAQSVLEAASYPDEDDAEARVYKSQLDGLDRELRGIPQPSGAWMSP